MNSTGYKKMENFGKWLNGSVANSERGDAHRAPVCCSVTSVRSTPRRRLMHKGSLMNFAGNVDGDWTGRDITRQVNCIVLEIASSHGTLSLPREVIQQVQLVEEIVLANNCLLVILLLSVSLTCGITWTPLDSSACSWLAHKGFAGRQECRNTSSKRCFHKAAKLKT